jgi:hypothetical protein
MSKKLAYVPYVPDLESWKDHFKNYVPSGPKPFYTIKKRQQGEGTLPTIKLVTPTQQFVEQAKSQMKKLDTRPVNPGARKKGSPNKARTKKSIKSAASKRLG